jgi:3-hydroxyisobutyrate dehydrogenase-like beta-hydroxyacid dehydrogenase
MQQQHYANPSFSKGLFRKDIALFFRESAALNLNASGSNALLKLLQEAVESGLDLLDYCALHELPRQA